MEDDGQIHRLRLKPRADQSEEPPLRLLPRSSCQHNSILVDPDLSEVECADCHAKLNPVAVLVRFARRDDQLMLRRAELRKEVAILADRLRFKCGACGQVNNIAAPLHSRVRKLK